MPAKAEILGKIFTTTLSQKNPPDGPLSQKNL